MCFFLLSGLLLSAYDNFGSVVKHASFYHIIIYTITEL
jgi:hypothetical protein